MQDPRENNSSSGVGSSTTAHEQHGSLRGYVMVFLGLLLLTGISFAVANSPIMNNAVLGWSIMMAVSVAKALLVALFFMHLIHERAWKYVLTIPAMIMAVILVTMLVPDIGMRTNMYSDYRAANAPAAQSSEQPATDTAPAEDK